MNKIIILTFLLLCVQLTKEQCASNFYPTGNYCYYVKKDVPKGFIDATNGCAIMNSSLPHFDTETEYSLFQNYWTANIPFAYYGFAFYLNLYSYNMLNWTWVDNGAPLSYHDFQSTNVKPFYQCAEGRFVNESYYSWFSVNCSVARNFLVCQTLRSDLPSTNKICPSNSPKWIPVGSYCYKIISEAPHGFSNASTTCALLNSTVPNFQNQTEYQLFKNYCNLAAAGWAFYINLYSYDSINYAWLDTGEPLTFQDFPPNTPVQPCACCAFNSEPSWFASTCGQQRTYTVCQTLRTDIPQPCYQIYRSTRTDSWQHRFSYDSKWVLVSPFILESYGNYYGLTSYVDGFTDTVYEIYPPGVTAVSYYVYGNNSLYQLLSSGYTIKKVAFYFPIKNSAGSEIKISLMWVNNPPVDSLLISEDTKNFYIQQYGWLEMHSFWAYNNTNTVCTSMSIDCTYSEWTSWSICSVTCEGGWQIRTRTMLYPAVGRNCSYPPTSQTQECNSNPCLLDLLTSAGINEALADPLSLTTTVQESIPFFLAPLSEEEKMRLGFQVKDNIKTCTYDGKYCNLDRDFKTIYNPNLGNCFTFNYQDQPFYRIERAGELYGVTLLLYSSQDDYMCSSYQVGFRALIHNSSTYPFPDNFGFYISPGYTTSVYVTKLEINSLSKPYGTCISNEAQTDNYFYPGKYSSEGCLRTCYQKKVLSKCDCADPRYPLTVGKEYCTIANKQCLNSVFSCATELDLSICNCRQACDDITFTYSTTQSQLGNSAFVLSYCALQANTSLEVCLKYAKKNFAVLKVSFKTLTNYYFEEQPDYNVWRLLNDFSGVTGLLLGVCVMTIPEILLLIITCCAVKCTKNKR